MPLGKKKLTEAELDKLLDAEEDEALEAMLKCIKAQQEGRGEVGDDEDEVTEDN